MCGDWRAARSGEKQGVEGGARCEKSKDEKPRSLENSEEWGDEQEVGRGAMSEEWDKKWKEEQGVGK